MAKLGILTNGVQWKFFTDYKHENVMDREPFVRWDVLTDENPPTDFLMLLQKTQFNPHSSGPLPSVGSSKSVARWADPPPSNPRPSSSGWQSATSRRGG